MISLVTSVEMAIQYSLSFIVLGLFGIEYVAYFTISQRVVAVISVPFAGTLHQYLIGSISAKDVDSGLRISRSLVELGLAVVNVTCILSIIAAALLQHDSNLEVFLVLLSASSMLCALQDESFGVMKYLSCRTSVERLCSYSIVIPRLILVASLLLLYEIPQGGKSVVAPLLVYSLLVNIYMRFVWRVSFWDSWKSVLKFLAVAISTSPLRGLLARGSRFCAFLPYTVQSGIIVLYPLAEDALIYSLMGLEDLGRLRLLADFAAPTLLGLKFAFSSYGPRIAYAAIHNKAYVRLYALVCFGAFCFSIIVAAGLVGLTVLLPVGKTIDELITPGLVLLACMPNIVNSATGPSGIIYNSQDCTRDFNRSLVFSSLVALGILMIMMTNLNDIRLVFFSRITYQALLGMLFIVYFTRQLGRSHNFSA